MVMLVVNAYKSFCILFYLEVWNVLQQLTLLLLYVVRLLFLVVVSVIVVFLFC